MSASNSSTGWQAALESIVEGGTSIRSLPPFDDAARQRAVDAQTSAITAPQPSMLLLAIPSLLLPSGWIGALGVVGLWVILRLWTARRRSALAASLSAETSELKAAHQKMGREFEREFIEPANRGELLALVHLMRLWHEARPESIRTFSARLGRLPEDGYKLVGTGVNRDAIPDWGSRIGPGRRTVRDQRKAGDLDEDLVELNAAAALSLLLALFSGAAPRTVEVEIHIDTPAGSIPWVVLKGTLGKAELEYVASNTRRPSETIQSLGGEVGKIRAQRFTTAKTSPSAALPDPVSRLDWPSSLTGEPGPVLSSLQQWKRLGKMRFAEVATDGRDETSAVAQRIPAPDPERIKGLQRLGLKSMTGRFGVVAQRWADHEGNPNARFVPFQSYYPTYESMDAAQLAWYFGWRTSFRLGQSPATDLSYIFVYAYELLHIVGVPDARHAGEELERLWLNYRSTYPKLDKYLVPWIADLYATEGLMDEVTSWYRRALAERAIIPDRELISDLFWAAGDYTGMPRTVLSTIAGDPKLAANKFCQEHNKEGWVDRGYREALSVADAAFKSKEGATLREATIARHGLVPFTREPFSAAIYDWKRHPVTLAKLPDFSETSLGVTTFRAATRHAENILRRERGFKSKLRGVAIDPDIAAALDAHFSRFLKATRPRTRVVLDLAKAKELAQESADVRTILLAGLEETNGVEPTVLPEPAMTRATAVPASEPCLDQVPADLLTDLAATQVAVAACSGPAQAVLRALAGKEWEVPEGDPGLKAAAGGVLVGPLIDEINSHAVDNLGDVLVVAEDGIYVVQEDFRDEVYWVFHGNLDEFARKTAPPTTRAATSSAESYPETDHGFGPLELGALSIIAEGMDVEGRLAVLGVDHGLSALLLIDRINELGLASPHGDILVDPGALPPVLIADGESFVWGLLGRLPALTAMS